MPHPRIKNRSLIISNKSWPSLFLSRPSIDFPQRKGESRSFKAEKFHFCRLAELSYPFKRASSSSRARKAWKSRKSVALGLKGEPRFFRDAEIRFPSGMKFSFESSIFSFPFLKGIPSIGSTSGGFIPVAETRDEDIAKGTRRGTMVHRQRTISRRNREGWTERKKRARVKKRSTKILAATLKGFPPRIRERERKKSKISRNEQPLPTKIPAQPTEKKKNETFRNEGG